MIDLGDLAWLTITVTDSTGALADSTVALTVTLPDQTPATPTPAHDSVGKYHYGYQTVQEGEHQARWIGTGAVPFGHTEKFYVEAATDISLVSLDDVKKQARITSTDVDDELRTYILSATENIESTIGVCTPRTFSQRCAGDGPALVLANRPVMAVTSITRVYPGQLTVAVSDMDIDLQAGLITRLRWPGFYGPYDVAYTAGRPKVQTSPRLACMMIVQHLWATRRGAGVVPAGDEMTLLPGWGYAIPSRAAQLLDSVPQQAGFA